MSEKILELSNVNFGYTKQNIFENLNMNINKGDFVALVGPNGAGKSTIIKLILNELKPTKGKLNLYIDTKKIGYVPQIGMSLGYNFPITVEELVSLSLRDELKGFRKLNNRVLEKIEETLSLVGMENYRKNLFTNLSGGQRQRVLIAKAIVSAPDFLILDEPTTGIDYKTRQSLLNLLQHINKMHNITILMVTHELGDISEFINVLYKLNYGKIERTDYGNI